MTYKKAITKRFDKDNIVLYYVTDTHIGVGDLHLLRKHVALIHEEADAWFHGGDVCNCVTVKDRRFDLRHPTKGISWEYHKAYEIFEPIADKGLFILDGNHDRTVAATYGDEVGRLGALLDIPTPGYWTMLNLKFPSYKKTLFIHHGAGGGRKMGAKAIRLKEWAEFARADMYLMGHNHTHMTFLADVILPSGKKRTCNFCSGLSYQESWGKVDNYAMQLGLPPVPIGCIRLEITKGKVKIEPLLGDER